MWCLVGWGAVSSWVAAQAPPEDAVRFEGTPVVRAGDAALLLSGQDGGAFEAHLQVDGTRVDGTAVTVRFDADRLPASVVLYVLQGDEGTEVAASTSHRLLPSSRVLPERLQGFQVVLRSDLQPPAEPGRIRLLVRSGDALALRTATWSGSSEEPNEPSPPVGAQVSLEAAPTKPSAERPPGVSDDAADGLEVGEAGEIVSPDARELEARVRRLLATGDRGGLEALEVDLTQKRPQDALPLLDGIYGRIEASVQGAEGGALLALATAHVDRAWSHGDRARGALARLASDRAITTAELLVRTVGDAEARTRAARVLSVLAGRRLTTGRAHAAEALFRRALDWNEGDVASRHGLAALLEKTGRFAEGADVLEPLTERSTEGNDGEVRLRWALCRLRHRARDRRALRELQRLGAEARPRWIAALAIEEWARRLVSEGRRGEALDLLEERRRRWPDLQGITIQLAHLLDGEGRSAAARGLLGDLRVRGAEVGEAPRTRYNQWPSEAFAESRELLREDARAHRPDLERTLTTGEPSE